MYTSKDISYIKSQDKSYYDSFVSKFPVYFIDKSNTVSSVFNSTLVIYLNTPVLVPVDIKFDNLKRISDRLNLKEIPEAVGIFSVSHIESLGLPDIKTTIEADVLIHYGPIIYRISEIPYPDDFIGNTGHFLHYTCVLERNSKTNYNYPEMVKPDIVVPNQANVNSGTNLQ